MAELKYEPVSHDHAALLKNAKNREGFRKAYENLKEEYSLIRKMLAARLGGEMGRVGGAGAARAKTNT